MASTMASGYNTLRNQAIEQLQYLVIEAFRSVGVTPERVIVQEDKMQLCYYIEVLLGSRSYMRLIPLRAISRSPTLIIQGAIESILDEYGHPRKTAPPPPPPDPYANLKQYFYAIAKQLELEDAEIEINERGEAVIRTTIRVEKTIPLSGTPKAVGSSKVEGALKKLGHYLDEFRVALELQNFKEVKPPEDTDPDPDD